MEAATEGSEFNLTARTDGAVVSTLDARDLLRQIAAAAWECADPGVQYDTTINSWHTLPNTGRINASNPCSEYMSIDDSACNLASRNLMKFRREDGELDVEQLEHAVDTIFLAQEILVGYSSYPTSEIERNAKAFRQLGLGYANLGALLMSRGLPYDSDEGRAYAAAITALMTGRAYRKSAEIAKRMGAFAGHQPNAAAMLSVMSKHRAAVGNIEHAASVPADLLAACRRAWDDALDLGEVSGYRNAQSTVLAPTGTISFMMDCDTTGVEPDFSLVKSKKLVGGGELTIVNRSVPMALEKLGYSPTEREEIVAFVDERNTVVGAPYLKTDHYPVFDCAVGDRAIHYEGYIHVGLFEDGTPGDIFVDIAKDGTTLQGLMNSLMIAVSMGLQYGVPPEVYVSKLSHMRFEPSGLTNDVDIRTAKSIVDYIFRWFGKRFLTPEQQEEAGILSPEVKQRMAGRYANGEASAPG